jgi:hypothetical protein
MPPGQTAEPVRHDPQCATNPMSGFASRIRGDLSLAAHLAGVEALGKD